MPRDGIDASWEIDVDVEHLLGLDAVACDEGADLAAKSFEGFGGVLEAVRYIVVGADEVALQVDQADVHAGALDVYADEVATFGVQTEEEGEATDTDLQLALALDTAAILEFLEDLRRCGDADV